jgi:protein gp37
VSGDSSIEWTDATWNPVTGCSKVSPGCAHCYAETQTSFRAGKPGWIAEHRPWTPANAAHNVTLWPERLDRPLHWRRPRMVFVNSMSDLFHEEVPDDFILRVFDVMRAAQQHTFQVLTKRPDRMRDFCLRVRFDGRSEHGRMWLADEVGIKDGWALMGGLPGCYPLPNVWVGTSIENRRFVGRADVLRETPAAVRFISAEPLLGPLLPEEEQTEDPLWADDYDGPQLYLNGIDWLIVGGESGPRHRPMDLSWVRHLRDATRCYLCAEADEPPVPGIVCAKCGGTGAAVAFFFKQWGGARPKANGRLLDGRTWDEMPTSLSTEQHA